MAITTRPLTFRCASSPSLMARYTVGRLTPMSLAACATLTVGGSTSSPSNSWADSTIDFSAMDESIPVDECRARPPVGLTRLVLQYVPVREADREALAESLRGLYTAIVRGDVDASAAYKHRLEGAIAVLDLQAGASVEDILRRLREGP